MDLFEQYGNVVILKNWGKCKYNKYNEVHWAYFVCRTAEEVDYWTRERIDEEKKLYWRHYEFLEIPCVECGALSPLRSSQSFTSESKEIKYKHPKKWHDYHPEETWPEELEHVNINGWCYTYFKKTMSDSLHGQETFKLERIK